MLPDYLSTSYQKYKADTDYIATWLATTAKQCGFVIDPAATELQIKKTEKLKGRARTLARRAEKSSTGTKASVQKYTYTVAVRQFLPMAQHIASYRKALIKVPKEFMDLLERAISLRKKVSQAVVDHQHDSKLRSKIELTADSQHSYFVGVLESVRNTLSHLFPKSGEHGKKASSNITEKEAEINLINMFEGLQVEEPSETSEGEVPERPPRSKENSDVSIVFYKSEQATDLLEAMFAFSCLLQDLRDMRATIAECWESYKKHERCSLIAAALTSNIAVELARRLEEDLEKFAAFEGSEVFLEACYAGDCWARAHMPSPQQARNDKHQCNAYDMASKAFFWSTYKELSFYLKGIQEETRKHPMVERPGGKELPRAIIFSLPGANGIYDPTADRQKMDCCEKQQEDRILLGEILSDMSMWAATRLKFPHDDEFKRGFTSVYETGRIPLWLVFAAQLFLDINHILRDEVGRGYQELCRIGALTGTSIEEHLDFQESLLKEPTSNDEAAKAARLLRLIQFICFEDQVEQMRQDVPQYRDVKIEQLRMLKSNPLLCGLKAYAILMEFHQMSLPWINSQTSIIACAHLHNALYSESLLLSPWKDMVMFLLLQDRSQLFAGDPPQDAEQYHRRFCLAVMGHSASNFARNRRLPGQTVHAIAGHRKVEGHLPISKLFINRYCTPGERSEMGTEDVIEILGKQRWFTGPWADDKRGQQQAIILDCKALEADQAKEQLTSGPKISMTRLLRNLRRSLSSEALGLSFDYLRLHRNSTIVLRAVKEATSSRMQGLNISARERDLRMVVGHMLETLAAERRDAAQLGLPSGAGGYGPVGRAMLQAASQSMYQVMNEQSNQLTTDIREHKRGVENMHMIQDINKIKLVIYVTDDWFTGELEP
ncbi:hypothetical protein H2200_011048 [Cladophialophora chaetospira]|uniref:DUF6604 domain-containing protein n=1 Tax=Cladophialophora chaetospira TaxID=386627 RepID=A0AA38WZW4_9EURO|nr:hypothetical protein H2200_011048 [Cladophialophora chaetospira]